MDSLIDGNIILIFFFTMIAIYNYSNLKEYQKIAIIYITTYSLALSKIISIKLAIILLFLTLFCFHEILSPDETKFKILVNPIYKIIDCLYVSFFQYAFLEMCIALCIQCNFLKVNFKEFNYIFQIISFLIFVKAMIVTLQQKFVLSTFSDMYKIFIDHPINKIKFDKKLDDACNILVALEDRTYFQRKGYTFLSMNYITNVLREGLNTRRGLAKIKFIFSAGHAFTVNTLNESRGYSTIPMQLMRSLGIKRGYNYKYRRKVFELLYSRMFFKGIERMLDEDLVENRKYVKKYYLYIYFHKVNTFLGDVRFSKFLNAFDMKYDRKNDKDIYDCSNEGIFIDCMGLSKRALFINELNIDFHLNKINNVYLDKKIICEMVNTMMDKPYNGNYLK